MSPAFLWPGVTTTSSVFPSALFVEEQARALPWALLGVESRDTAFSLWISRGRALPTALPWLLSFPSAALLLLSQTSILKGPGHFLHHPSGPGEPPQAKMISPPPLKGPCPSFTPYHMLPWIIAGCFCLRAWLALRAEIRSYSSLYPPRCLA